MIDLIIEYREGLLDGLWMTAKLTLVVWVVGTSLGIAGGLLSARLPAVVGIPARVVAFLVGATPVLVFLFWLHYPAQSLLGIVVEPFWTAALTLSIVNVFAVQEVVRPAILTFPTEYIRAAAVCGLSDRTILVRITMPLIIRQVLPGVLFVQVAMLHATLFASLISVDELFRVVQRINATEYRPVELYSVLALFFLAVSAPLMGAALFLQRRFGRDFSEL